MIIYRCDRCKKDFSSKRSLFRMTLEVDRFCDAPAMMCYKSAYKTIKSEICADCAREVRDGFILKIGIEYVEDDID